MYVMMIFQIEKPVFMKQLTVEDSIIFVGKMSHNAMESNNTTEIEQGIKIYKSG